MKRSEIRGAIPVIPGYASLHPGYDVVVTAYLVPTNKIAGQRARRFATLSVRPRFYPCAFFFANIALMLSNSSILAPCLRMMMLCCATDSELFQAQ
jgi:hypothetical protein